MRFEERGALRLLQFDSFSHDKVVHGVFTRHGGVSEGQWASLNLGGNIGDEADRVAENRRRALQVLERPPASTYDIWQIHSAEILTADQPHHGPPYPQADGLITANPAVTLLLRFADCVPILLYDPRAPAVGLVHAGWKGTVKQTTARAVEAMGESFGSRPQDLRCAIGPAIAEHHYPVGPEVVTAFQQSFGEGASRFLSSQNGATHLALPEANAELLRRAGVEAIEMESICTACDTDNWYSHRGEDGRTGRFGAIIALRPIQ